jgi:Tfp pilus assembly PilM family ATPase
MTSVGVVRPRTLRAAPPSSRPRLTSTRLIIEISPSRVEVATLRGSSILEWRSERFQRADWPSPYTTALPEVTTALSRLLSDLNSRSGAATVVYSAPGSVSAVTSFASAVSAASYEQASLLALANVADFPIDDAPSDTCLVFSDRVAKGTKDAPGPPAQRHILAAADAEARSAALTACVEAAGLKVDRILPVDAVCLADAIKTAAGAGEPGDLTAIVWIGEHSTSLAVAEHGRLLFVRTIAAGSEGLAEVLCRPLRPRDPNAPAITLTHDAARSLLFAAGIPAADAPIASHPTLAGSSLLPHLQPVLQRLSIEIKQSLRFGVPEGERAKVRLRLAGPGAAIPGLGDSIARAAGFPFDESSEAAAPDGADSSTGGVIAALSRCPAVTLALMPTAVRQAWELRRSRKALVAGAIVALLYVGYETVDVRLSIASERARLAGINSSLQTDQGPLALRQQAMAAHQQVAEAESRARRKLDQTADWSALLESISEQTPLQIRLTSLEMRQDPAQPASATLALKAYVRFSEAPDPARLIHDYVERLQTVPIVSGVRLVSAQRVSLAGHDAQSFDLSIAVVPVPSQTTLPPAHAAVPAHPAQPMHAVAGAPTHAEVIR